MANYDLIGNIAIVKFKRGVKMNEKKKYASHILNSHKSVKTVLEKTNKFSGRLRTQKTKYVAGYKTREAVYRENGCIFRLNVDSCYFSPRLAGERREIASKVKRNENVLVLFSGVAPFSIVIAKLSKAIKVTGVEISRECNKYARENVKLNKLWDKVEVVQGDVRKKLKLMKEKFDRIVMPRPNLKDSFLNVVFPRITRGGIIHYYGFYDSDKENELKNLIFEEAKKARRKIKILKIKRAGEIGVKKFRYRVDIRVVN